MHHIAVFGILARPALMAVALARRVKSHVHDVPTQAHFIHVLTSLKLCRRRARTTIEDFCKSYLPYRSVSLEVMPGYHGLQ